MKRLYVLLVAVLFSIGLITPATAQNQLFEKYSDMDDVEYICITKSMLKMLASKNGTVNINGVNVKGVTDAIKVLVIVNSTDKKVCKQMETDFRAIKANPNYEVLMMTKDAFDNSKTCTLYNDTSNDKELVMYISEPASQTFIVITGALTREMINSLMAK